MNLPNLKIISAATFILLCLFVSLFFAKCNGCKKPAPAQPTVPQVIEQQAKPQIDSIIQVAKFWQLKYDSLAAAFKRKEPARKQAQNKVSQSISNSLSIAERQGYDSVVSELNTTKETFENYVAVTDAQLTTQGQMIVAKDSIISVSYAQVELEKGKFKQLTHEYSEQEKSLKIVTAKLAKTERKLKRAKFLNKVFIPGAIIMGGALGLIVF
jgi:uncharacterized protein YueI